MLKRVEGRERECDRLTPERHQLSMGTDKRCVLSGWVGVDTGLERADNTKLLCTALCYFEGLTCTLYSTVLH